jgi:diguanylate cyclase (GGDEF)-like protein
MFIDIDNFKWINDSMGHDAGDLVLKELAKRMKEQLRTGDLIARNGGDEFVLILHEIEGEYSLAYVAIRLLEAISPSIKYSGITIQPSISIGIANFPDDGTTKAKLLRNSDIAMYKAKESGGNTFSFYQEEYNRIIQERFEIEQQLMRAIDNGELSVAFQPIIDTANGSVFGV